MGTAITSIPYAFALSGYVVGPVLVAVSGIFTAYSLFLLSACAHRVGGSQTSFNALAQHTYPWASIVVDFVVAANCIGSAIGFTIIVGQLMSELAVTLLGAAAESLLASPQLWIAILFWGVMAPLAALKDLSMLRFSSMFGFCCVLYIVVMSVAYSVAPDHLGAYDHCKDAAEGCQGKRVAAVLSPLSQLQAIPIVLFAFGNQFNVFLVYNEIKAPSLQRMTNLVAAPAAAIAAGLFTSLGLAVYSVYGDAAEPNLLLSFPSGRREVQVADLALALVAVCSFPLQVHPCRSAVVTLLCDAVQQAGAEGAHAALSGRFSGALRAATTAALLLAIFTAGFVVSDLGLVFQVIGAVAGTGLTFYLPAAFFYKLFADDEPGGDAAGVEEAQRPPQCLFGKRWLRFHRRCCLVLVPLGLLLLVGTLGAVLSGKGSVPSG